MRTLGIFGILGSLYITFWVSLSLGYIGQTTVGGVPYDIWFSITFGLLLITPFILGYLEGKRKV